LGTISQNLGTNAPVKRNPIAVRKEFPEKERYSTLRYSFTTDYHKENGAQHFRTHQQAE